MEKKETILLIVAMICLSVVIVAMIHGAVRASVVRKAAILICIEKGENPSQCRCALGSCE